MKVFAIHSLGNFLFYEFADNEEQVKVSLIDQGYELTALSVVLTSW